MAMVAVLLCHSGDMKNENIFVFSEKKSERERWSHDGSWYRSTYDELDTRATIYGKIVKPAVKVEVWGQTTLFLYLTIFSPT